MMKSRVTRGRRGRCSDRGYALISAIVFLVVVLLLGGSLIQQTMQEVDNASRAKKETRAFNLSEAGIDYAAWQLYNHPTTPLPATWTRTDLDGGRFSVTASIYNGMSGVIALLSTGTSQADTAEIKVVGQFMPTHIDGQNHVFDYALFSNTDVTMKGTFDVTGNAHTNANATLQGGPQVTGNLSAAGTIKINGSGTVTGTKTAGATRVGMPVIDLQYFRNNASVIYTSGHNFSGQSNIDGIVFVDGDADINGSFRGKGTIVVTGQVRVNGNATLAQSGDEFAIVAAGGVRVNGTCRIEGWVYTHNITVPGLFQGNGTADIVGGVAADVISASGTLKVQYKVPTVEMPGASIAPAQFEGISWHRTR